MENEDSSEESSNDLYGDENSSSSKGQEDTSSKEDTRSKEKKTVQVEDKSSSEEDSEDEIQVILVTSPKKKRRTIIQESSDEDIEEESEDSYEIPIFNMEHLLEKRMMAKFHEVQVDKLVKLSNFWYVKNKGKSGYNPVALKYPTKEYGDKFKKKLVEKRGKENDAITLALGGSPSIKGRARLRKKVTPIKNDTTKTEKPTKSKQGKQAQKERKSTSPTTKDRKNVASKDQHQKEQQ